MSGNAKGPRLTPRMHAALEVVRRHGPTGAMCAQVRAALPDLSERSVQALLSRLVQVGLATQPARPGPYIATDAPVVGLTISVRNRCLAVVAEYVGGISDEVLAEEMRLTVKQVRRALDVPVQAGAVRRISMPKVHGGGKGYAMPAAAEVAPPPSRSPRCLRAARQPLGNGLGRCPHRVAGRRDARAVPLPRPDRWAVRRGRCSMSISQRALILIRLDARRDEGPVSVADLAIHMNLSPEVVCLRIEELRQEGYVQPVLEGSGPYSRGQVIGVQLVGRLPQCA